MRLVLRTLLYPPLVRDLACRVIHLVCKYRKIHFTVKFQVVCNPRRKQPVSSVLDDLALG